MPTFADLQQQVSSSNRSEFPYRTYRDIVGNCFMLMTFLEIHHQTINYGDIARDFASQNDVPSLADDKLIAEHRLRGVMNNALPSHATRHQIAAGLTSLSYLAQVIPLPEDKLVPLSGLYDEIQAML